jgi:hypothetical protein
MWQLPGSAKINSLVYAPTLSLFAAGDSNGDVRFVDAAGQLQNAYPTNSASFDGVHAMVTADVLGNGATEFAIAAGQSFLVITADGSLVSSYDVPNAGAAVAFQIAAVDFNGDGAQDIVGVMRGFFTGTAYAFSGRTGELLWSAGTGIPGGIAAMDVEGDGREEVLLGTEAIDFPVGQGTLKALDVNGNALAMCTFRKSPNSIAVAAFGGTGKPQAAVGMAEGDIYLLKTPGPSPVPLNSVVSRKVHGSVGTFDVDLTSGSGIECRSGGANGDYTLVFTFANPLTTVGSASVTSGTGSVSGSSIDPADAHNYVVNLTGVVNAQTIALSLTNVTDSAGNFSPAIPASMGVLLGDVNGSRRVDAADVSSVRQQTLQSVTNSNFREDINASGRIDAADVSIARQQTLTSLP